MKFLISYASLIAAVVATPIPFPANSTGTAAPSGTTVATAYATATATSTPKDLRISPETISRYHISTGEVEHNVHGGQIFRQPGIADEISTLGTFYIPEEYAGKQCSFGFDVDQDVSFDPKPSYFDVFTSQKPAWESAKSWPSGNLRDHHAGRMKLSEKPGKATLESGHPTYAKKFECPTGYFAGELVPVGDAVDICFFATSTGGPYITIHL